MCCVYLALQYLTNHSIMIIPDATVMIIIGIEPERIDQAYSHIGHIGHIVI